MINETELVENTFGNLFDECQMRAPVGLDPIRIGGPSCLRVCQFISPTAQAILGVNQATNTAIPVNSSLFFDKLFQLKATHLILATSKHKWAFVWAAQDEVMILFCDEETRRSVKGIIDIDASGALFDEMMCELAAEGNAKIAECWTALAFGREDR